MPLLGLGKKKKKRANPAAGSVGRSPSPTVHPAQLEEEERKARQHADLDMDDEEKVMVDVPVLCRAQAICPYEPDDFEVDADIIFLRFDTGAFIDVIDQDESGWWEGFVDGQNGIFPGTYVRVVEIYGTEGAAAFDRRAGEAGEVGADFEEEEEEDIAAPSDPNIAALQKVSYDSDGSGPPELEEITDAADASPAPRQLNGSVDAEDEELARLVNGNVFEETAEALHASPDSCGEDTPSISPEPERQIVSPEPETQANVSTGARDDVKVADVRDLGLDKEVAHLEQQLNEEKKKTSVATARANRAEKQAAALERDLEQQKERQRNELIRVAQDAKEKSGVRVNSLVSQLETEKEAHAATQKELASVTEKLVAVTEQLELAKAQATSEANSAGSLEAEVARRQAAESSLAASVTQKERLELSLSENKHEAELKLHQAEARAAGLEKQLAQATSTVESLQKQVLSVVPDLAPARSGSPARFVSVPADSPGTVKRAMKPAPSLPAAGARRPAPQARRMVKPAPPSQGRRMTGQVPARVAARPLPQPPA